MRPTGIGYVSPRERTPAYYTTFVSVYNLFFSNPKPLPDTYLDEPQMRWTFQPTLRVTNKAD